MLRHAAFQRRCASSFCFFLFSLISLIFSVVCFSMTVTPSSILYLLSTSLPSRRLVGPEQRGKGRPSPPVWQGGPLNRIAVQKAGADRRIGGPLPEEAGRAGALLMRVRPTPRDPASRLRAAVPIRSHPTVSGSKGGLPLTDARMSALEPLGTSRDGVGRVSCTIAKMGVSSLQLSQDHSPPKPFSLGSLGPR